MKKILFFPLFIALMLTGGCKTRKQTRITEVEMREIQKELHTVRSLAAHVRDTLRETVLHQMDGEVILWSAPDSTGRQYKEAEVTLRSRTERETIQHSMEETTGLTTLNHSEEEKMVADTSMESETRRNSYPFMFSLTALFFAMISGLLVIYRWRK